jgi:hypothetical protein
MTQSTEPPPYCAQAPRPVRPLPTNLTHDRLQAIIAGDSKWANGTVLHYWFFSNGPLAVPEPQRAVVRAAFAEWKALGVGLSYVEVADASESEVRIAFSDDGSWSMVGRDVLHAAVTDPTMNFGWDLTTPYGHSTARHEIGHTLGLEHEHQNPFAGIVWNEEAVYASLGGPPNNWPREQTFFNILRKLSTAEVSGSTWDPDSIMEYDFGPGLIKSPAKYASGVHPPGTISAADRVWALQWYPPMAAADPPTIEPFQSVPLMLQPKQQADFTLKPPATRTYQVATFGTADTVLVLFEKTAAGLKYVAGDDDSGTDRNASVSVRLLKGHTYVVRLRLYWVGGSGGTAVMYW